MEEEQLTCLEKQGVPRGEYTKLGATNPNWKGGISAQKKVCPFCKSVFVASWRRLYCSSGCRQKDILRHKLPKTCLHCKKQIPFTNQQFSLLKYCSRKCAYESPLRCPKKERVIKKCFICKKNFLVLISEFDKRKYCSRKCMYISTGRMMRGVKKDAKIVMGRLNREEEIRMGLGYQMKMHSHTYRKMLGDFAGGVCSVCHKKDRLVVHHVDGNRENNQRKNLIPLCYSCHFSIHIKHINSNNWDPSIYAKLIRFRRMVYGRRNMDNRTS